MEIAQGWGGLLQQSVLSAGICSELLLLGSSSDVRINPCVGLHLSGEWSCVPDSSRLVVFVISQDSFSSVSSERYAKVSLQPTPAPQSST